MLRESFDYVNYLNLKKMVDDRSLNPKVWDRMVAWVRATRIARGHLRVLEIGAGIGTMIERLLASGVLTNCHYTALELEPGFDTAAGHRHQEFARSNGYRFEQTRRDHWSLKRNDTVLDIHWVQGDALQAHRMFAPASFDLLIGHAVIDLFPVPVCMPELLTCLDPAGGFYFSLSYAGETLFLPPLPGDETILAAYNADMDKRFPGLDWQPSRTGQLLVPWLVTHGHPVIAEGDSDWKLRARTGDPANLFIENILATIETALAGMPGLTDWLVERRGQLARNELMFRATNRDCFGLTS